jgi:integrase/recombinase XerD
MTYLEKEYVSLRTGKRLSGPARDNFWKAIRSFCGWSAETLSIPRADTNLSRPAYAVEEIVPFTESEIRRILDACDATKAAITARRKTFKMRRPTGVRDRAIVLLLLETGIRLGELSRLKIADVNLEAMEIRIHPYRTGKKSKARTIPFEKGCRKALWHYCTREREDAFPDEPFFPIESHSVQSLFARIEQRTGIEGVHPHRFRHTFAIQYLRNGGDIFTLQRILGHSSLDMCRRYLAIAQSDIKDAHRRASPVDRWRL